MRKTLRRNYLLALGVTMFLAIILLYLTVQLNTDAAANAFGSPIRDMSNRRSAMVEHNEFERIQAGLLLNASKDPIVERRNYIKAMTKFAWSNYRKFAWGANELKPIMRMPHSGSVFGAAQLGATIIDGIDTLWIMGLKDEYEEARAWIRDEFDLTTARSDLSVFETNIRYVGGLLSIYALSNDRMFLDRARAVADLLMPAFDTPTGIPLALVNPKTGKAVNYGWASGGCSILSEIGSLELEFAYLSRETGNKTYLNKARAVREHLAAMTKDDGLYPNYVNPRSGRFCQRHISVGALGDSFYEYLLKVWIAGGRRDAAIKSMYDNATAAIESHLLYQSKQQKLWYFAELKGIRVEHKMDHLACFIAGMYALQAKFESDPDKIMHTVTMAKEIGKTCRQSYINTETKIGPESFRFTNEVEARAIRDGERYYLLRPEVIEGFFYLWRVTGNPLYRDWCWEAVQAIDKHCRVEAGFSGIRNVDQTPTVKDDVQQSFVFAETFKYLYLAFADDTLPLDKWVFNTEAHPLPIQA